MRRLVLPLVLALIAVSVAAACGDERPPAARLDCAYIRCTATARHCRTPMGSTCANDDYTAPQPVVDPAGQCLAVATPADAAAECRARLCDTCLPPMCVECTATVGSAVGCPPCGGDPGAGAAGKTGPVDPSQAQPPGSAPSPFLLRGYEYTRASLSSTVAYEYRFDRAHGEPRDIATLDNAFFVSQLDLGGVQTRNVLGGIGFSLTPTGTTEAELDFTSTLAGDPVFTLDGFTFAGTPPAASSFDAFVGSTFETRWWSVRNGAPSLKGRHGLAGQVGGWAPSPFFVFSNNKPAVLTTALANEVCYVDYQLAPPQGVRCVPVQGTPVAVSASIDLAWVVTINPNRAIRYFLPSLGVSQSIELPGRPSAVAGGTLAPGVLNPGGCEGTPPVPEFHLAIALATPTGTQVRAYPAGNLQSANVRMHSFEGTPVTMATASLLAVEHGWLATTRPNRLYRFVVSNPSATVDRIELNTDTPLRLSVGGTGGINGAAADTNCDDVTESVIGFQPSSTGRLHVLLRTF